VNKVLLLAAFLILPVSISSQEPTRPNDPCFEKATSQSDMTTCATEGLKNADAELNLVYRQLLLKKNVYSSSDEDNRRILNRLFTKSALRRE
jgi:uncharacterized protein YecT (DUF1311 family)